MPTRPLSPCGKPGCSALLPAPGYCAQHQHARPQTLYDATRRKDDPALALAARLRGRQWRKVRDIQRQLFPLCADPFKAHGGWPVAMQQVHHIEPLTARPDLAYELSNLASLCTGCHSRVEGMERRGEQTRQLFNNHANQA